MLLLPPLLLPCLFPTPQAPTRRDGKVSASARLALDSIVREFPNKPGQVYFGPESAAVPREIHPVFYLSFDLQCSVPRDLMVLRVG